jgi:hypothetical protein
MPHWPSAVIHTHHRRDGLRSQANVHARLDAGRGSYLDIDVIAVDS